MKSPDNRVYFFPLWFCCTRNIVWMINGNHYNCSWGTVCVYLSPFPFHFLLPFLLPFPFCSFFAQYIVMETNCPVYNPWNNIWFAYSHKLLGRNHHKPPLHWMCCSSSSWLLGAPVYKKVKNYSSKKKIEKWRFILVQKKRCICNLTCEGGKEQGRLSKCFWELKGRIRRCW